MRSLRLAATGPNAVIFDGLPGHPQLTVSLHSSARMRLLGAKAESDLDLSDPGVLPRIEQAVLRLINDAPLPQPMIELTALDLD